MKITRVEPILISVPYTYGGSSHGEHAQRWPKMETLLVKVETDEGLAGWGEAFGFSACATTRAALATALGPACIGRDPRDIAGLTAELQRKFHNYGRSGPLYYGLSGIDIALWDIAGQIAGQPIYKLLGGAPVERLPSYASLLRYDDPALVARNSAKAVEQGYRQIKLHEIAVAETKAARDAIGPDIPLMLDTNCRWAPENVIAEAKAMEPFNLHWIEEPVWPPENYTRLGELSRSTRTAMAAGENHSTLVDFEHLIDIGKVRYIQPSITKVGGFTAMKDICALAKSRGVVVAPHSPYFGPGLVASAHLCASLATGAVLEQFYCVLEARPFDGGMSAMNGFVNMPNAPGLGVVVDHDVIARYRVA